MPSRSKVYGEPEGQGGPKTPEGQRRSALNARFSTGPRTAKSKTRAAFNASRHGLFSRPSVYRACLGCRRRCVYFYRPRECLKRAFLRGRIECTYFLLNRCFFDGEGCFLDGAEGDPSTLRWLEEGLHALSLKKEEAFLDHARDRLHRTRQCIFEDQRKTKG